MMHRTLLLAALLLATAASKTYRSGSTTVTISEEILDDNNSTKRCVTYESNQPEKYDTACFSSFYTDGGTFERCEVHFGDEKCNSCHVCETSEKQVGYDIDCYNAKPSVNTEGCDLFTDENVQGVLVDEAFTTFDWDEAAAIPDDGGDGNESGGGGGGGSSGSASAFLTSVTMLVTAGTLLYLVQ